MCGLTGFVLTGKGLQNPQRVLHAMTDTLAHRGPDGEGVWFDTRDGVGLGHRRLSIVDLSQEGRQPMVSHSGRFVISYNGEVYNHKLLRDELEKNGAVFRGHCDTEVMLAAFDAWGVERAVQRFVGMFAFAVWDRDERRLTLVRDRLGIKPLYYGFVNGAFVFASELKALRPVPGFTSRLSRDALALLFRHNYIPAPYSIYEGIGKLRPGHLLTLRLNGAATPAMESTPYWSVAAAAEQGQRNPYEGSAEEAVEELDHLLHEAVGMRMMADVPLGAFLSGGVDSSTVVAMMQTQSVKPVKTFAIGFHEDAYNEAQHAKAVAAYLGTEHTELYVTPKEAMDVIPQLPALYDEPFSDPSQIPTYLVSRLAHAHVTVALSGDGGDELFHGYPRYFEAQSLWNKVAWMPPSLRRGMGGILAASPLMRWRLPRAVSEILSVEGPDALYRRFMSHWKNPAGVVMGALEPHTVFTDPAYQAELLDFRTRMTCLDLMSYLPDDILVKVDRASMGVGLEARVPLLDHRLVEFALRLPSKFKQRDGAGKWILRQVLYKYVPKYLIDRPKMGFGVPIDEWLRGPLREWGEHLLGARRLHEEGVLNVAVVRKKWQEHLQGKHDWQYYLWDVLMFQAWQEAEGGHGAIARTG
jgi:asparagine synthase (glutamine-hydrolysing)